MANATPILDGKFWILEDNGIKIGTLTFSEDQYMFSSKDETQFFKSERSLRKKLGKINWTKPTTAVFEDITYEVHGYRTSYQPHNPMFDVKHKLPLFTKSPKSKGIYCAGYYVIKFDKGWVKSFCPKLVTLEHNEYKGPYKTELEAKQELQRVKSQRTS